MRSMRGGRRESPPDDADRELLARHCAGDPDAFSELFARHRDRLWAVALRTTGNAEDAADALQDAAVSAFRAAAGFRGQSAVGTWLYRITVNAGIDRIRHEAARPTTRYPEEESASWQRAVADPADMAAGRDLRMVLEAALRELPIEQRAAVVAVDVEGLSVEEAAAALGVPEGTVKSRCARGRAKLALMLADLRNRPGPRSVQSVPERTRDGAGPDWTARKSGGTGDPTGADDSPETMERGVR
jgi:RNA polymerase sigma-70 factor (ECF subfamily)